MALPQPLAQFFRSPDMYVPKPEFDVAAGFLQGFDAACGGRVLEGFTEWLVQKIGYGNNLGWTELFLRLAFPDFTAPRTQCLPTADQKQLVNLLAETFSSYWKDREVLGDTKGIMERHAEWLRKQDLFKEST